MSKSKSKSKAAARKARWRKCTGVSKTTGRVKKGYKVARKGHCPVKAKGKPRSKPRNKFAHSKAAQAAYVTAMDNPALNGGWRLFKRRC